MPGVLPLLVLVACAIDAEPADRADSAALPIVNGDLTSGYPSAGALLSAPTPSDGLLRCSGTLIGCDTFLTAAHCVCPGSGGDCQSPTPSEPFYVFFQHAGFFKVTAVRVHPAFSFPDSDIAVLTLEKPVTGITPTPLQDSAPPLGTAGTIVGFGRTGGANQVYGLKYEGSVTTGTCPEDIDPAGKVCWTFNGQGDANTCNGDSGGPLFFESGGVVRVGGTTSGGIDFNCLAGDNSYDNDVFTYKPFIEAGSPVSATCGALPQVGNRLVAVETDQGTLAEGETAELTVEVPRGTTELRVALNSSDGSDANFDVAVSRGGMRDEAMSCTAATPSAYEFCTVSSPEPDVWDVSVQAVTGGGDYQVTATVIGGGPVGVDDAYTAFSGRALEIDSGSGVLANDEAPLGSLSGAEVTTPPEHGTLELAGDGSFVYTAEAGYVGPDSFQYRASDGSYATTGVATLTVEPASEAPGDGGVFAGCAAGGSSGAPWLLALVACAALFAVRRRRPGC